MQHSTDAGVVYPRACVLGRRLVQAHDTLGRALAPTGRKQHGAYSFFFQDLEGNWWEILANPPGGYSPMYANPTVDLTDPA